MLRVVYGFFVGILLAVFVGVGINVFYQAPETPKAPDSLRYGTGKEPTEAQRQEEKKFDAEMETFNKEKMNPYNRNVSIVALIAAVIFMAISLVLESRIPVIADGIMLGGVFTLLYSLGRSLASQDSKYTFAVVTIGLLTALILGYKRFINPATVQKAKRPVRR